MLKRLLSLSLATALAFSVINTGAVRADAAADDTMTTLVQLIKKFPHGKYWNHRGSKKNNPEKVTSKPCKSHNNCSYYGKCYCNSYGGAIQCMGYANMISEKITGVPVSEYKKTKKFNVKNLRVGDIVREGGHSLCITGIKGNKISITDCNYGARCIIRWTTVDKSWFSCVEYVLHLKGNDRKNTKVNFHDKYKKSTATDKLNDDVHGAEIWRMEDGSDLNIRVSPRISADMVSFVPAGSRFKVYGKKISGGYLWGKIEYDGVEGYSALNYADYISGAYDKPNLSKLKTAYEENTDFTVKWKSVSGADKYTVIIYNSKNKKIASYKSKTCKAEVEGLPLGSYYIKVIATSKKAPTWKIEGAKKKLNVSLPEPLPEKVTAVQTKKGTTVSSIGLSWSESKGADGYEIYRYVKRSGKYRKLTETDKLRLVDRKLKAGVSYSYKIKPYSVRDEGRVYGESVTVKAVTVPGKVTGLTVVSTDTGKIKLQWNDIPAADCFVVYERNETTGKYKKLGVTKKNTFTVKGNFSDKAAYCVVAAIETEDGYILGNKSDCIK